MKQNIMIKNYKWSDQQYESHEFAVKEIYKILDEVFLFLSENIRWALTDHDLSEYINGLLERYELKSSAPPLIAFGLNSSKRNYLPNPSESVIIRRNGWLLINITAKKNDENFSENIYADLNTSVILGNSTTENEKQLFSTVTETRDLCYEFLKEKVNKKSFVSISEINDLAKKNFSKYKLQKYFSGNSVSILGKKLSSPKKSSLHQLKEGAIINIAPSLYTDSIGVKSNLNVIISDFDTKITNQKQEKIKYIDTST
ncbi:MAG: hypothetical protein CL780_03995 [Chloroflexi bacterium]|nr:hypothetical protein [Chloroflexota bacterium]|tara:strand:- start:3836 stop:4606 length:771 start_codon:yes stop_codon:yes gene_type:complete